MVRDIIDELGQNFIDFSYEANSARAFADARDGFKPGQRACIWEMYKSGYTSAKPHVKSAKIDGAVSGNWWPHGNVALYDTFVRMSQSWINNIPEVDIHGNNGSVFAGPDPASDRYTEARLSKIAELAYFQGIKKNAVNMIPNYSEDAEWPEVLPAILPRLMINGCQGIGSTIANVWLPHNAKEISNVVLKYIKDGVLDFNELYPDFPSKGIIINKKDIHTIYETGKGKVVLRGKAEIKGNKILITELPYQVYVQPYVEKVRDLAIKEEIDGISDISNDSGKKKLLITVECSKAPVSVLSQLYAKTDLQKSFSANQWALIGKTPKLLTLKDYIEVYVNHNLNCIEREAKFDKEKAIARLEIVDGLLRALEDIDNIIALIKASKSSADAKDNLMKRYDFTENQAKAIVGMKLGSLANLEQLELNQEKADLKENIQKLTALIENKELQKEEFSKRLLNLIDKYGEPRKTELTHIEIPKEEKEIATVVPEDVMIVATSNSIKRVPLSAFKVTKRNTKGVKTTDDLIISSFKTNTVDRIMIFTNLGKMYSVLADNIPEGNNTSTGTSYLDFVKLGAGEQVVAVTSLKRTSVPEYVIFTTAAGYVKKSYLKDYNTNRSTGVIALGLNDGDKLVSINFMNKEDLILITKKGMSIHFKTDSIGAIGRTAKGIKGIKLNEGDSVIAALPVHKDTDKLALFTTNGIGKKTDISDFPIQGSNGRGVIAYKLDDGIEVAGALMVDDNNTVLLSGNKAVCISAKEIPLLSRIALGNIMIKGNIKKVGKF